MAVHRHTISEVASPVRERFLDDVIMGLSAQPKYLKSKYFYDAEGDRLFQRIMESDEYYLTDCEMEIFTKKTAAIAHGFLDRYAEFDIIELGAGDASKSIHLLKYLSKMGKTFTYFPVDISDNVIDYLEKELPGKVPGLQIHGLNGEYMEMIQRANEISSRRKVVLFLGATIGNFSVQEARTFLITLQHQLAPGDMILVGFDLKKDPRRILAAYNDRDGITRAFNLNLLKRMNRELDADFNLNCFEHFPVYDPISGSCKSYLISLCRQQVHVGETVFEFEENEPVFMELSQKYSVTQTDSLARSTGFRPMHYFMDSKNWFLDAVWEKI